MKLPFLYKFDPATHKSTKEDDQKPFSYRSVLQLQLRLCPAVGRFRRKNLDRCHVAAHRRQVQRGAACEKRTNVSFFE